MMDLAWKWEAIRQVNTRGKFQGAARPFLKSSEHSKRDIIIL